MVVAAFHSACICPILHKNLVNQLSRRRDIMSSSETRKETIDGALLAYTLVAVLEGFLGRDTFDRPLTIAMYCFAVASPLLASMVLLVRGATWEMKWLPWPFSLFRVTARFLVVVGTGAIFWHFSTFVGLVFLSTGIFILLWLLVLYLSPRRGETGSDEVDLSSLRR
jgi:hypothetical protein